LINTLTTINFFLAVFKTDEKPAFSNLFWKLN
jgi:hypothetical protein